MVESLSRDLAIIAPDLKFCFSSQASSILAFSTKSTWYTPAYLNTLNPTQTCESLYPAVGKIPGDVNKGVDRMGEIVKGTGVAVGRQCCCGCLYELMG